MMILRLLCAAQLTHYQIAKEIPEMRCLILGHFCPLQANLTITAWLWETETIPQNPS